MMYSERMELLLQGVVDSLSKITEKPMNERSDWPSYLNNVLEYWGLDPLYTLAIITNLITVVFWRDFKKWRTNSASVKFYDVTYVFALFVVNLICLIRLFGLFDS